MIRSIILTTIVSCSIVFAQSPGTGGQSGTITGSGSSTIDLQPDRMVVKIDVLSRGSGLKPALAGLKKVKTAASAKLVALGADKASIKFKSPRITSQQSEQQQQMMEMMKQRLNARRAGGGAAKKGKKKADPVVVAVSLTAEWKLEGTVEEVLVKTHELQMLIRDADISGKKAAVSLSPEEQELLEEAQEQYGNYRGSDEPSPGDPAFMFVSKVPDEARDKAMADAFKKAKMQASRLAAAAGMTPGTLLSLQGTGSSSSDEDEYSSYRYRAMMGGGSSSSMSAEARGAKYGPLSYVVNVVAGFAIKAP